ncbi:MAG: hypothetical protein PVJ27_00620 [Candidatus Brocadiaceae bacterium]|jgi:hypothetical protein
MSDQARSADPSLPFSTAAVFLLSAAVIALELALMRCLSVARWHHFSYLVISTALLGFGASGTFLAFVGERLQRRFGMWALLFTLVFALSVTVCFRAAESLPLDVRYVLYSARQAGLMLAHDFLLFIPFFCAATVIGLSLMHFAGKSHLIYGGNLAGSGLGALLATGLMFLLAPEQLLHGVAALALLSGVAWVLSARAGRRRRMLAVGVLAVLLALTGWWSPVRLNVDQYKDLATFRRWERQGNAQHLLSRHGPRARLDVYASSLLHRTMFAGLTATEAPPPQLALLADGHHLATVLEIDSPRKAGILDHTPMSVPYRLLDRPRVVLLGEAGGTNVWLARRMGAGHITVVQPNPQVVEVMRGPVAKGAGEVFSGDGLTVVTAGLREYLERTGKRFDLIQIVAAESPAAGVSGLRSLHEDFLLTEEGMALCLSRLTGRGMVVVTRGVQEPPRDNVRLFATMCAALERRGGEPAGQLVQVRNLLAATTLAFAQAPGPALCATLAEVRKDLALDVEWAPCPGVTYSEQVNEVAGPEGEAHSYFHHAARSLLSAERERFFANWVYDVRPATDDSPYFYSFFRWRSLPRFWQTYGHRWLTKLELGYVVVVFALAQVVLVGGVLILLPLVRLRRARGVSGGRSSTFAYFCLLGLGFMMLEMVCLLKFTQFLGDPIYSAAGMLTSFLVFSGIGSVTTRRLGGHPRGAIRRAAGGVALMAILYALGLDGAFALLMGLPLAARLVISMLLTAPAAFLMGWLFPNGLALLERHRPRLVPWAWGANGFASVAASPLAVMIAIDFGFRAVLLLAGGLYLLAAIVSAGLQPGPTRGAPRPTDEGIG